MLGLFVPHFDSYMVIHGNLYAGVTLVIKKTKTDKNNRVLLANSYAPDDRAPAGQRVPTVYQAAKAGHVTGRRDNGPISGHATTSPIPDNSVIYSYQGILFQQHSHISVELKH